MNFISLTTLDEDIIYVRADSITEVWTIESTKRTPAHSGIITTARNSWRVKESPDEILRRINAAMTGSQ